MIFHFQKVSRLLISVGLLSLLIHGLNAAEATPAGKSSPGLIMKRQNGLGEEILLASRDGVKFSYPRAGYCTISRPPEWDVTYFSLPNKTSFTQSLSEYRISKSLPATCTQLKPPAMNAMYAKCKALKISKRLASQDPVMEASTLSQAIMGMPKSGICEYYFMEPYPLPTGALAFVTTFFGTPNFGCIPLAMVIRKDGTKPQTMFDTYEVKKADIAESEFDLPKGYKQMHSKEEVAAGAGYTNDLKDFVNDMKMGEKFGSK